MMKLTMGSFDQALHVNGQQVRVLFWNFNVLTASKAIQIEDMIDTTDVILGVELGRDVMKIPGFVCFPGVARGNQSEMGGGGRGQGMASWVRQRLAVHVNVAVKCDCYMWLKIDIPGHQLMHVCCSYFPPQSSSTEWGRHNHWKDAFGQFQTDVRMFQAQGTVLICGDFNAHTGTDDDTGSQAQQLLDDMATPGGPRSTSLVLPARVNPDPSPVCAFGRLLLTTCICAVTGCIILNGRCGGVTGELQPPWGCVPESA